MRGDFPLDRAASPRWLTVPLSWLYSWSATRYHRGWDRKEQHRSEVPVISIGNLAVGGTGKSPTVIALTKLLWERYPETRAKNALAILSRGYGRQARGLVEVQVDTDWRESGDEPLMIKRAVPEAAVIVEPERTQGAAHAVKLGAKLILLDDGFQHRPLDRDVDLVMVDGEHPLGNGRLLPAGPLREKSSALVRSTVLCAAGENLKGACKLAEKIGKPLIEIELRNSLPKEIVNSPELSVFVISGIARPERLLNYLKKQRINIVGDLAFGDHHPFGPDDREAIFKTATEVGAQAVLTTEKDLARMDNWNFSLPMLAVGLEYVFRNPDGLISCLEPALSKM